jgi:hypothetical protein
VILILTAILYYYKPSHRLTVGIIAVTFGGLGSLIYFFNVLFLMNRFDLSVFDVSVISLGVLTILQILTVIVGVMSLRNRVANAR